MHLEMSTQPLTRSTKIKLPRHFFHLEKLPTLPPQISTPACNGRIDFYRLVTTSNRWYCFANAGITSGWGTGYWNDIKGHCPGANRGRMHYYHSGYGIWAWTVWRGPVSDHRTCYWFSDNQNFAVATVHIG